MLIKLSDGLWVDPRSVISIASTDCGQALFDFHTREQLRWIEPEWTCEADVQAAVNEYAEKLNGKGPPERY